MTTKPSFPQQNKRSICALKEVLQETKGEVTGLGLLLSLLLLSYALCVILKCQNTSRELKNRLEVYQCLHYLDVQTDSYLKMMGSLNKAIFLAHKGTLIPATAAQSKVIHQALIAFQSISHLKHLKNITQNSYCSLLQNASYVKNLPYQTLGLGILQRDLDGTAILKKRDWTVWVTSSKIVLRGKYEIEAKFSSKSKFEAREETAFLSHLSGSVF